MTIAQSSWGLFLVLIACGGSVQAIPNVPRKASDFLNPDADFAIALNLDQLGESELARTARDRVARAGGFLATLRHAGIDPFVDLRRVVVCGGFEPTEGWLILVEHRIRLRALRPLVDSFLNDATPNVERVNGSEVRTAEAASGILVTRGLFALVDTRWLAFAVRATRGRTAPREDFLGPVRSVASQRFDALSFAIVRIPPRIWSAVTDAVGLRLPGPPSAIRARATAEDGLRFSLRGRYGDVESAGAASSVLRAFVSSGSAQAQARVLGLEEAFAGATVFTAGSEVVVELHLAADAVGRILERLLPSGSATEGT